MKNKRITVIEISHKLIKLVIGSVHEGSVILHYSHKLPIEGLVESGIFIDIPSLLEKLLSINPIHDEQFQIDELIDEAVIVVPPFGVEVYETDQLTAVSSKEKIVGSHDIVNLYNIIANKKLPVDNDLIDIVPDAFFLANQDRFAVPPIGKVSNTVVMKARVLCIPGKINKQYTELFEKAGIKITHRVVSTYALSELLATYEEIPHRYFLVDIGANASTVSLIGNKKLIATRSFSFGGSTITEKIISVFNVSEKDAESLKTLYGIDKREMHFDYAIVPAKEGSPARRNQDLNVVIEEALNKFATQLANAITQIGESYKSNNFHELPIVITGGSSQLKGLLDHLKKALEKDNISLAPLKVLGARDPSLLAALGAIYVHNKHSGVVEEINETITPVSREE